MDWAFPAKVVNYKKCTYSLQRPNPSHSKSAPNSPLLIPTQRGKAELQEGRCRREYDAMTERTLLF